MKAGFFLPLQLKPWNSLARVRVENAIVLAMASPPWEYPISHAHMVAAPIRKPWNKIFPAMEKKGSLLLGLWEAGLKDPGLPVPYLWQWQEGSLSAG